MTDYFAVEPEGDGFTTKPTDETGPIHIDAVEEKAGLPTAMMEKTYPVDVILHRLGIDDILEVGPLGGDKTIGLYAAHFDAFVADAVESPYRITVGESVKPYIDGETDIPETVEE